MPQHYTLAAAAATLRGRFAPPALLHYDAGVRPFPERMTVPAIDLLAARLRAVRRRLLAQRLLNWLGAGLLAAGGALLAIGAIQLRLGQAPFQGAWVAGAAGAALLAAAIGGAVGWKTLPETARWIDARAGTHDRFQTALAFGQRAEPTPFEALTLAECARYIAVFPVPRWTPIRVPRQAAWIAIPAISLALICWHAALGIGQAPPAPALDAAVAQRANALEKLAEKLKQVQPAAAKSPELDRLAAEMQAAAKRLKSDSGQDAASKTKSALGELSSLEAMLDAMKQAGQSPSVSPAELAALAAALAANDQTRAAGESLQKGELEKAAGQLESLLQQLKAQGNATQALAQLAQSLQEQAAKLTEAEKNEVARQMEQAAQSAQSGETQLSEQALQRLAELLRRAGKNGANGQLSRGSGQGTPMTERQLESLLSALENMKNGLQQGNGQPSPGDGNGNQRSLAMVESFGKPGQPGGGQGATGAPGSERDEGTRDNPLGGPAQAPPAPTGPASRIEGILGNGQSLEELVGANADRSKSSRPYKELYQALAPAAQDAVEQEDIPLGSRPFIRRYFENIRPRD